MVSMNIILNEAGGHLSIWKWVACVAYPMMKHVLNRVKMRNLGKHIKDFYIYSVGNNNNVNIEKLDANANNSGHGIGPPRGKDPLVDRPSLLLWLAVSAPEAAGERVAFLYVEELRCSVSGVTQIVQMAEHWHGSPEDLGSVPGLGLSFFHIYLECLFPVHL